MLHLKKVLDRVLNINTFSKANIEVIRKRNIWKGVVDINSGAIGSKEKISKHLEKEKAQSAGATASKERKKIIQLYYNTKELVEKVDESKIFERA